MGNGPYAPKECDMDSSKTSLSVKFHFRYHIISGTKCRGRHIFVMHYNVYRVLKQGNLKVLLSEH